MPSGWGGLCCKRWFDREKKCCSSLRRVHENLNVPDIGDRENSRERAFRGVPAFWGGKGCRPIGIKKKDFTILDLGSSRWGALFVT